VENQVVSKVKRRNLFVEGKGLCAKGNALPKILNDSQRLQTPLKRSGSRGDGKWEAISWNEALDLIAAKLEQVREESGSWALAWDQGYGPVLPYLNRFMHVFGSPNLISRSHVCSVPRRIMQKIILGRSAPPDVAHSRVIVAWGNNKLSTSLGASDDFLRALRDGAKLIVIDPRPTPLAKRAFLWLQPRPGTDGALALGLINALISEGLYDADFVAESTVGFPELAALASQFPPERTAEITWVSAEKITAAARLYGGEKPASLIMGNALDQHTNSSGAIHAILCLMGVSGNLNRKGGNLLLPPLPVADVALTGTWEPEQLARRIGGPDTFLSRYRDAASTQKMIDALLEDQPGRPRMLVVTKGNPLVTLAEAQRVRRALAKIEFLVVSDFVLTETARLADLVLPAAFSCEGLALWLYDPASNEHYSAGMQRGVLVTQSLPRPGDQRTDTEFIFALAGRLGLGDRFWEGDIEAGINERLRPLGLTVAELVAAGGWQTISSDFGSPEPAQRLDTPSGKVELLSSTLQQAGHLGLPVYLEPAESPLSTPQLRQDYPLILSSQKPESFVHSAYRWVPALKHREAHPVLEIHPDTAQTYGVVEGREVEITSPRGECRMLARVNPQILPGVVHAVHGWGGEGNVNRLTSNAQQDPVFFSSPLKSLLCRVKGL
jgi:anaerobic selenocysteine-containing dehydrogenase